MRGGEEMAQSKVPAALRIISMMCFVFAFISLVPALSGATWVYAVFMAFCLVQEISIQATARGGNKAIFRVLLAIIPLLATAPFLFVLYKGPRMLPAIAIAIIWLWYLIFNARDSWRTEYWRFKRTYIAFIAITLLLCLVAVFFVMAYSTRHQIDMNMPAILGFTAAGGLVGFIVLSEMRSGEPDLKWRTLNAARIIGIFVVAALVLILAFYILKYLFSLIRPVEDAKAIPKVEFQGEGAKMVHAPYGPNLDISNSAYKDANDMEYTVINYIEVEEQKGFPWQLVVIGVLIAGAAAFIVYRIMKRRPKKVEKVDEELPPEEKQRQDNIMKIRATFKTYMDYVQSHGAELEKGSTSEDVINIAHESEASNENLSEAEKTLREIYIRARYGKSSDITEDDVKTAQSCLDEITKEDQQ